MTLTDFLLARLAEDEAIAATGPVDWDAGDAPEQHARLAVQPHESDCAWRMGEGMIGECVCGYPARVLAEVEAKRRIVEWHTPDRSWISRGLNCATCIDDMAHPNPTEWMPVPSPCPTLRHLASVYADHPDFREEWRA